MENKKLVSNLFMTTLFWILEWLLAAAAFRLMFARLESTGKSEAASLLPVTVYKPDPVCYMLGALLSLGAMALVWHFLLHRNLLYVHAHGGEGWKLIWYALSFIGMGGDLVAFLMVYTRCVGILGTVRPAILSRFYVLYIACQVTLIIIGNIRINNADTAGAEKSEAERDA